jgi:spore coat protein U-like protein
MKMRHRIAILLMLALMPSAGVLAQSQTATATFIVKTTVQAVCSVAATDLNFGVYSAQAGGDTMTNTTVIATCTPGTTYNIALGPGGAGNIYAGRQMSSGPNKLNYQLYRDAGRTNIWGNTIGTDTVVGGGGTGGLPVPHTVYGTLARNQVVPAGSYQDTIVVTITY